MKKLICALIMGAAVTAMAETWSGSSGDGRWGGSQYNWTGGVAATNASWFAVIPPSTKAPVLTWIEGWNNARVGAGTNGVINVYVATNTPISITAATLNGETNFVTDSSYTNIYGNMLPSNTVLLIQDASQGVLQRGQVHSATGQINPGTNVQIQPNQGIRNVGDSGAGLTTASGDKIYPLHRIAQFKYQLAPYTGTSQWETNPSVFVISERFEPGLLRGIPGKPMLIESLGFSTATNDVMGGGFFE